MSKITLKYLEKLAKGETISYEGEKAAVKNHVEAFQFVNKDILKIVQNKLK